MINRFIIARYRFTVKVTTPMRMPDYAGSALRGAFGHALMQLSGIEKADVDNKTPAFWSSLYAQIFKPQASMKTSTTLNGVQELPVPYVIEPTLASAKRYPPGERFMFDLVLTQPALAQLPIILLAWRRALKQGLGNGDGTGEIWSVEHETEEDKWQVIYHHDNPVIHEHHAQIQLPTFQQEPSVEVKFTTPLRLQQRGKLLVEKDITGPVILRALIRRVSQYLQMYNADVLPLETIRQFNALADNVRSDSDLTWRELERYSSRQQQKIKLSGVVGRITLFDVPHELQHFLYLGRWLHIGKETAFGLGRFEWQNPPWSINCVSTSDHQVLATPIRQTYSR